MTLNQITKALCNAPTIIVDCSEYKELINVQYEIPYHRPDIIKIQPNEQDDDVERKYIMNHSEHSLEYLIEDRNSRRAVFPITYVNGMGKCICLVHLFIRDQKLHINEYFRSQNFQRNFEYDCETACMVMENCLNILNKHELFEYDQIEPGTITVFCANLHIKLKRS